MGLGPFQRFRQVLKRIVGRCPRREYNCLANILKRDITVRSRKYRSYRNAYILSPFTKPDTLVPTSSTVPAPSRPRRAGKSLTYIPKLRIFQSSGFNAADSIFTRSCSEPGLGTPLSRRTKSQLMPVRNKAFCWAMFCVDVARDIVEWCEMKMRLQPTPTFIEMIACLGIGKLDFMPAGQRHGLRLLRCIWSIAASCDLSSYQWIHWWIAKSCENGEGASFRNSERGFTTVEDGRGERLLIVRIIDTGKQWWPSCEISAMWEFP